MPLVNIIYLHIMEFIYRNGLTEKNKYYEFQHFETTNYFFFSRKTRKYVQSAF